METRQYHYMHHSWPLVELTATEHGPKWNHNQHRVVIAKETSDSFVGWPDPTDKRNSEHWKPGIDKPLLYPKFAWEVVES